MDGSIYFLLVDFEEQMIRVYCCGEDMKEIVIHVEIPLTEVKDCYNLKLDGSPVMLTRQGGDGQFQIIWPEKTEFSIGARESFLYREGEKLYFSQWHEDPDYREEIIVREFPSGKVLKKIPGSQMTMPNGESWILQ